MSARRSTRRFEIRLWFVEVEEWEKVEEWKEEKVEGERDCWESRARLRNHKMVLIISNNYLFVFSKEE